MIERVMTINGSMIVIVVTAVLLFISSAPLPIAYSFAFNIVPHTRERSKRTISITLPTRSIVHHRDKIHRHFSSIGEKDDNNNSIPAIESYLDFESLMDMDVVLFSRKGHLIDEENNIESEVASNRDILDLGAMQEDGTIAPLSTWSNEAYLGDALQFLVDENDWPPGLTSDDVDLHELLTGDNDSIVSYGSRQVGGGKGPGNPHGEESEIVYYIDGDFVEKRTGIDAGNDDVGRLLRIVINPDLEILW